MKDKFRRDEGLFNKGSGKDSTQLLQLSLFIMLLAFFIVLNMTSQYEEGKVQPIIQSLYKAFSSDLSPPLKVIDDVRNPIVKSFKQAQSLDYIDDIFKSELPKLKLSVDDRSKVLSAGFDRGEFEDSINTAGTALFDRIVAAMIYLEQDKKRPLAIEIAVKADMSDSNATQAAIKRADGYARQMIARGVPEYLVALSLYGSSQHKDDVTLSFRPFQSFAPDGDIMSVKAAGAKK